MTIRELRSLARASLWTLLLAVSAVADTTEIVDSTTDSIVVDGHIHTPAEIFKLLDQSELTYEIDLCPDSIFPQDTLEPAVLPPMLIPEFVDGEPKYTLKVLSDSGQLIFEAAETLYGNLEVDSAMVLYSLLYEREPYFAQLLTLKGDVHFTKEEYDSAAAYYRRAISENPVDYQCRWFLGNALWHLGDTAEALREITIAHVLNVNHELLKEVLIDYRARVNRPWHEWSYVPRYYLHQEDNRVLVRGDPNSIFYAMTKALWAYEPGYVDRMRDTSDLGDALLNLKEERESVACALFANDSLRTELLERVGPENISQFVLYEVILKRHPQLALHFQEESRNLIVDYVDRFH